jgi:hypothetical protein
MLKETKLAQMLKLMMSIKIKKATNVQLSWVQKT